VTPTQVTRQQRIFTAVVISGMACAANAVLIFGFGTTPIAAWKSAVAWFCGVALAVAAIYIPGRSLRRADGTSVFASQNWIAVAAIPFAASFIWPDFAGLFFAACCGGLTAVAGFVIARVGPSERAT
jgi:hypothetical protein